MGASTSQGQKRRRCSGLLTLVVALVVVAEIAFLGRLDMAKNAAAVHSWTTSLYFPYSSSSSGGGGGDESLAASGDEEIWRCEERLEREDAVPYARDFDKDPVLVSGMGKVRFFVFWSSNSVPSFS